MEGEEQVIGIKELPTTKETGDVIWTSADPAVATVDEGGRVKALQEGETTITAEVEDHKGEHPP